MHMGIVTLIVFLFFGTSLALNYQSIQRNADEMLRRSAESGQNPIGMAIPMPIAPPREVFRSRFSPIFTIELDAQSAIIGVRSAFDVEYAFYEELTNIALTKKQSDATIHYDNSTFRYLKGNHRFVFLDISKEMQTFNDTIYTFLWIAVPLLVIIFLISLYFANRSIKPIEETYLKQKEFIADASHELKTPLAVISTNADALSDTATEEQQKWIRYIKSETKRMANLTSSLLFLTKLDYLQEKSESVIDFSKLVKDYLLPLEALFYENKIKTNIEVLNDVRISGDEEQIRQLVGVLVDNALKYTDGIIEISLKKSEHEANLTVYNNGNGIAEADLTKIWDRFYRGDKARESDGGYGLGLPIAKSIIEKHRGSITVESKADDWTRFTVRIPLA